MRQIETDYLVIGAGASGMAFVDALLAAAPDIDVVMVDRRHRPGGHWLDAYPFVRLHQPSANYGVNSRMLGHNRIDDSGINAGFYERATSAEICDYFSRVMDETFLPSGRVRFLGVTDYRGEDADGHHVVHLLTGEETVITVRRKFVDATYTESSIPSKHNPSFEIDADVRFIPPNDLVDLAEPANGFTVIGAGKTGMDTVNWLVEIGVDPEKIQWFRPRDPWLFNREFMQPLDLVGGYMALQGAWVEAAAKAEDGADFCRRMEAAGVFLRIDSSVEPTMFRGATVCDDEVRALRAVERVVTGARVRRLSSKAVLTDDGEIALDPGQVVVDCTAAGVRPVATKPIFEPDRLTLQYVTIGIVPYSAATIGTVEGLDRDDDTKNRLCPPLHFSGVVADVAKLAYVGMSGINARGADPEVSAWNDQTRLNPAGGASQHMDDPRVPAAFTQIFEHIGPAMENLARFA